MSAYALLIAHLLLDGALIGASFVLATLAAFGYLGPCGVW